MKKVHHILKNKKVLIGLGIIIVAVFVVYMMSGSKAAVETATAKIADITEQVDVTGKVTAWQKAELGFEKAGRLAVKNLKAGDPVKAGQIIASLDVAEERANLNAELAKLADLEKGLRTEELSVEQTKVANAQIGYDNAKNETLAAIRSAYNKVDAAVRNYTDAFFTNPQTANPNITLRTENQRVYDNVNNARIMVGEQLSAWKGEIDTTTDTNINTLVVQSKKHLDIAKDFFSQLVAIMGAISTGNSGMSQAQIDANQVSLNTAYSNFTSAVSLVVGAESTFTSGASALDLAKNQFALKQAGASTEAIQAQAARVALYQSQIAKSQIISPIDGIVTKADPEVGEFVAAGPGNFAVISNSTFKIEVFVPEVDIAKIAVGNTASITLDAYDSTTVFKATVVSVDPAETIVEGVPTYKVVLKFDETDARIRSGMTANIELITSSKNGVVVVPRRAVRIVDGKEVVRIVKDDVTESRPVMTGVHGSDGNIEIVNGLNAGEVVSTSLQ